MGALKRCSARIHFFHGDSNSPNMMIIQFIMVTNNVHYRYVALDAAFRFESPKGEFWINVA